MKRIALTATAAVVALLIVAVPANATHVQCGATITQTTTLDSDVVCPDGSRSNGIVIAASEITLNLNGYTVRAGASGGDFGIISGASVARVAIKNGRIEGFDRGVHMESGDSAVFNLGVKATSMGILVNISTTVAGNVYRCEQSYSASTCVFNNVVEIDQLSANSAGIAVGGGDAQIWGNTIRGVAAVGISTTGERARTVFNKIESCNPDGGFGVTVAGYATRTFVWGNSVAPCATNTAGVNVATSTSGNGGARVRRNAVSGNSNGILIFDSAAIITDNTANENLSDGINVHARGTTPQHSLVSNNTANNNGLYGIYAPDVQDGGGNTATGNGEANCVGVVC